MNYFATIVNKKMIWILPTGNINKKLGGLLVHNPLYKKAYSVITSILTVRLPVHAPAIVSVYNVKESLPTK